MQCQYQYSTTERTHTQNHLAMAHTITTIELQSTQATPNFYPQNECGRAPHLCLCENLLAYLNDEISAREFS